MAKVKNQNDEVYYDEMLEELELIEFENLTKKVSKQFSNLKDANQARFTIDSYYQMQDMRINTANKIRADIQGLDNNTTNKAEKEEKLNILYYQLAMFKNTEDNLKKILDKYSDSNYLSRWARQTIGIGPVLAASLPAYLEIKKEPDGSTKMHASSWWSYAGLNNNNNPWLGSEASRKLVNQAIEDNGGILDDACMDLICVRSQWKIDHFRNFKDCYKVDKKGNGKWSKDNVIKACSVIPYNKKLKTVCYLIGTSFHKLRNNDNSLYGRLFNERLMYEMDKNERGDYAEQAAELLKSKNFTNKEAKNTYQSGKLPMSHIYRRVERYVTKLFISHAFEAAYYNEYGCLPPQPYSLCFCEGHNDYIGPEVPYESIPRDCELK